MELLNLHPWRIRVDKEKSSEYCFNNDLSEDKIFNTELIKILDKATLEFLEKFGIDLNKARVEFKPAFPGIEDEATFSRDCYLLEFIFAGYFEAIPSDQWDFYFDYLYGEPPIFQIDENIPESIAIDDIISIYKSKDKMGIYRFSPASAYDDSFEGWNSGYIFCKVLFRT